MAFNESLKDKVFIVKLSEEAPQELPSRIVCVHLTWMQNGKVKYKSPSYDFDGSETMESFLLSKSSPPSNWLLYSYKTLEEISNIIFYFLRCRTFKYSANSAKLQFHSNRLRNCA